MLMILTIRKHPNWPVPHLDGEVRRGVKVASHRAAIQRLVKALKHRNVTFERHKYLIPIGLKNVPPNFKRT